MRGLVVVVSSIVAATVLATACGGDDDTISARTTDAPTVTEPTDASTDDAAQSRGSTSTTSTTSPTSTTSTTPTASSGTTSTAPRAAGPSSTFVGTSTTVAPTGATPAATPTTVAPAGSTTTAPPTTAAAPRATVSARSTIDSIATDVANAADGTVDFDECPLDPTDEVITRMFGGVRVDAVERSIGEPTLASAYEPGDDLPAQISCDRYYETVPDGGSVGEATDGIGIFAMQPPGDVEAFARAFANPDGGDWMEVTVTRSGNVEGGELFQVCALSTDDPTYSYCEIYWSHPDLVVGAFVAGATSVDVDLDALQRSLTGEIDTIVDNLAG